MNINNFCFNFRCDERFTLYRLTLALIHTFQVKFCCSIWFIFLFVIFYFWIWSSSIYSFSVFSYFVTTLFSSIVARLPSAWFSLVQFGPCLSSSQAERSVSFHGRQWQRDSVQRHFGHLGLWGRGLWRNLWQRQRFHHQPAEERHEVRKNQTLTMSVRQQDTCI